MLQSLKVNFEASNGARMINDDPEISRYLLIFADGWQTIGCRRESELVL